MRLKAFSQLRHLLFGIAVVLAALIVCLLVEPREQTIRTVGMILQLLGIGTVACGISSTRRIFGLPSLQARIATVWKSLRAPQVTHMGGGVASLGMKARGLGYSSSKPRAGSTTDERLDSLERNIEFLNQRISDTHEFIDRDIGEVSDRIEKESAARMADTSEIKKKLFLSSAGGLELSTMGILWLSVGVVLSSIPI